MSAEPGGRGQAGRPPGRGVPGPRSRWRGAGLHADAEVPPPRERRRQFVRSLEFVAPDRGRVGLVLFLTFSAAALTAVEPLVLKLLFDQLAAAAGTAAPGAPVGDAAVRELGVAVLLLLGVLLAHEAVAALGNWLMWGVHLRVKYRMLGAAVGRLHTLPVAFHREHTVGELMTRLDRGISGYVAALAEVMFSILPSLLYLALAIVFMASLDLRLTALVLLLAPLPALVGAWAAGEQTRRERKLLDWWVRIYSRFNEVLSGIVTVRSFAMEDVEKQRFLQNVEGANAVVARGVRTDSSIGAVRNSIAAVARVAALGLGGWLVLQGEVTLGTLVAFLGYIGGLFGPVQGLTGVYQTLRRGAVSLDTTYRILDTQDRLGDAADARPLERVRGEVAFEGVTFGYHPSRLVLRGVDLRIAPGESVAVVGPSGSGKSTLIALLQRLYDPVEGTVRVDGHDLRDVRQRDLRRNVGVVLQDPHMLDDTVRNVIAYARPDATDEEVEAAARAAQAHDFIMQLPEGYQTRVGERGGRLSAGQRQRIAIARTLIKDPPVVVLDEATSALDAESEAGLQEALRELTRDRTTIVIAHRLSTVVGADRIVVLRDGRITEEGRHETLMAQGGYYASLVRHQTRGLLEPDVPRPFQWA